MRDLIITINANTRKIKNSKNFLGINGENLNGNLIVDFEDEFIDGFAYLEVFDGSQKYLLTMEKVEDHYVLPILSSLLATVGDLQCQIRINSQFDANSVSIFKSEKFELPVLEAINATETMPEQYPTWIEEADLKILNIQNDLNAEITARQNADTSLQNSKQDKTDNNLNTTDKTVVGAINELKSDKQDNLSQTQLDAVNSGITSQKVSEFEAKQDALTQTQLDAVNSGANSTNIGAIANKVDKTSTANKLYATDSNGDQTTLDYQSSQTNSANKIVQRDSNGDVLVPSTPSSNNGATSKSYVDSKHLYCHTIVLYGSSTFCAFQIINNMSTLPNNLYDNPANLYNWVMTYYPNINFIATGYMYYSNDFSCTNMNTIQFQSGVVRFGGKDPNSFGGEIQTIDYNTFVNTLISEVGVNTYQIV